MYDAVRAFADDCLLLRCAARSNIGACTSLDLFTGSSLRLRQRDGARVFASTNPQPAMLHDLVRQGKSDKWDKAVRLARCGREQGADQDVTHVHTRRYAQHLRPPRLTAVIRLTKRGKEGERFICLSVC